MFLRRIRICNLRNLQSVSLPSLAKVNILHGDNGSGKTSFLESVHLLGLGRPLRRPNFSPLICRGARELSVFGEVREDGAPGRNIGFHRVVGGTSTIRINGQTVQSTTELLGCLPLQTIDAGVFSLLEGTPGNRRQFMDWGVFHIQPSFLEHWRRFRRCLRQRNILLRRAPADQEQLRLWSREMHKMACEVDQMRGSWMESFKPIFDEILGRLWQWGGEWSVKYQRGWPEALSLEEYLHRHLQKDREIGYTRYGPQASDIAFLFCGVPVRSSLSRGQKKVFAAALRLAQGVQLWRARKHRCVFLVDDLSAELDRGNRERFCNVLQEIGHQVFLSTIEARNLTEAWPDSTQPRMFHVKHGEIAET